jgi:hypothetical protein
MAAFSIPVKRILYYYYTHKLYLKSYPIDQDYSFNYSLKL